MTTAENSIEERLICAGCGEEFPSEDLTEVPDGRLMCDDCMWQRDYHKCIFCSAVFEGGTTDVGADLYICEDCLEDKYEKCDRCEGHNAYGEFKHYDIDEGHICECCLINETCDVCGCSLVPDFDEILHLDDGRQVCPDCFERGGEEEGDEEDDEDDDEDDYEDADVE